MDDIFIGRQPIYDRDLSVYAYELLFRAAPDNTARFSDGDQATSNVIVNTFMEIGLDNIVGQRLAFINLTRSFLVEQDNICLPRERVVLELLEHIEPDAEVIEGIKRLAAQGYAIALDDFVYHDALQPLVQLADIVKVDVMAQQRDEIRSQVHKLRQHPLKLLAEKVETRDEFDFCRDLGFDYFQGYFFAQPQVLRGQRLPNNRLAILHLLSRLQDPNITPSELEELIVQDVTFSYRILRYVNSAAFSLARKIESVHQAVVILGQQTIKTWTTLLAMSQVDNKPTELVITAMVRGKMAEALAKTLRQIDQQLEALAEDLVGPLHGAGSRVQDMARVEHQLDADLRMHRHEFGDRFGQTGHRPRVEVFPCHNVAVQELHRLLEVELAGWPGREALLRRGELRVSEGDHEGGRLDLALAADPALFQGDGLHPTAAGQRRLAETIVPYLASVLDEIRAR